ncbi:MAG TPA: ComEC/Rec2 family competence protein [Planctomycetes bacterium]|nr:ComEC/Rec2 family competence protein [Planctomycetota bacterium]
MPGMGEPGSEKAVQPRFGGAYHPLGILLVAVCVGIVADRFLDWPLVLWWAAAALAWGSWFVCWRLGGVRAASLLLMGSAACCAAAWHHCRWQCFEADELGRYARLDPRPVCVEAIAASGPARMPAPQKPDPMRIIPAVDRTRVELRVTAIRDGAVWRSASGRVVLTVDGHLLGIRPGNRLRILAKLSAVPPAMNPGEPNRRLAARAGRRLSRLWAPYPDCVKVIQPGRPYDVRWWVARMRAAGDRVLWSRLEHQRAGLAAAVLLGLREELDLDTSAAFMETGTAHLLAISGLHVGIMAGLLGYLLRLLVVPPPRATVAVAALTVFYALLTAARTPAVRATILVVMFCAAYLVGRRRPGFNSLAAAGLVVLLVSPADLFSTGSQLSFLAVGALMFLLPHWFGRGRDEDALQRLVRRKQPWLEQAKDRSLGFLRDLAMISIVVWIVSLPLVMSRFHLISPAALVLNVILWVPMALALAAGFGVLAFSWLVPPLGQLAAWICDGTLSLLESTISAASRLPGSHFWVPGPPTWWMLGFYGALGLWTAVPRFRPPVRWQLGALGAWIAVGLVGFRLPLHGDTFRCRFLAVGHGASVALLLPCGHTILYDAGRLAAPEMGSRQIAAALWECGVTRIDAVILSHADADHYNALPGLLERFSVGAIYVSPYMFVETDPALIALKEAIRTAGVPIRVIAAGDRLDHNGAAIEVVHPPRPWPAASDNANCLVLAVEYQGYRILLPGDLEAPGLDHLLQSPPWDCDVLLAPHHGSRFSDPPGLAAWCRPEWVVISGSLRPDLAATTATYRRQGGRVLLTAEVGGVDVVIKADGLQVKALLARPAGLAGADPTGKSQ